MKTKIANAAGIAFLCLLLSAFSSFGKQTGYLEQCWDKQVKPLVQQYLIFNIQENRKAAYTGMEAFAYRNTNYSGVVNINAVSFSKIDSMIQGKTSYTSKIQYSASQLLYMDYGDTSLYPVTREDLEDQFLETAHYNPVCLIYYFFTHKPMRINMPDKQFAIYQLRMGQSVVSLFVRRSDGLLEKLTILEDHEQYGDVLSTISYKNYAVVKDLYVPRSVFIDKINGKLKDTVMISNVSIIKSVIPVLQAPADFKWQDKNEAKPEAEIEKYNDHIYFIALKHVHSKVMVVELSDFLLVADAPISSSNGELVISEARKIAPGKPIKYFSFGHRCKWIVGGVRPFVHKGITILCNIPADTSYLNYVVNAPHTLNPDSLHMQPAAIKTELLKDSTIITDGSYVMKIYLIGKQSAHTDDFMIYYFPEEKLLWEDDLAWVKEGKVSKAGIREVGLYQAIKGLKLDVQNIAQSWGVGYEGVKTIFTYADLEASINQK